MDKLEIIEAVVDTCLKSQLETIFAPLSDLSASSRKAKIIIKSFTISA